MDPLVTKMLFKTFIPKSMQTSGLLSGLNLFIASKQAQKRQVTEAHRKLRERYEYFQRVIVDSLRSTLERDGNCKLGGTFKYNDLGGELFKKIYESSPPLIIHATRDYIEQPNQPLGDMRSIISQMSDDGREYYRTYIIHAPMYIQCIAETVPNKGIEADGMILQHLYGETRITYYVINATDDTPIMSGIPGREYNIIHNIAEGNLVILKRIHDNKRQWEVNRLSLAQMKRSEKQMGQYESTIYNELIRAKNFSA